MPKNITKKRPTSNKNSEFLFEVAWEVCNKIGGIHTVLTTKHLEVQKRFKDNYCLIGPFEPNSIKEFIPTSNSNDIPENFKKVFHELNMWGIKCHYGKWNIEGKPSIILIDFNEYCKNNNEIKTKLWDLYKIDSLGTDFFDFDRAVNWAWACGVVIEKLSKQLLSKEVNQKIKLNKIIAHFHEWMAGAGVLYLKQCQDADIIEHVKTVFTTHATVLGRVLAGNKIDPTTFTNKDYDEIAKQNNVAAKHLTEKQSAINSDSFTTVSIITANEANKFFGKYPKITYNGIDMNIVPSKKEIRDIKTKSREKIKPFLENFFRKKINMKNTTIMSIFGRYEFHVKGIDIYANAIGNLNKRLKEELESNQKNKLKNKTIIACFFIPAFAKEARDDIIHENRDYPLQCTHYLGDEQWNQIMKSFADNDILNFPDDKVNVLFCPIYLNGEDGLLNITYKEAIIISDLGVFPSFYEPWGYTPVEALAYATPATTSDLAGFGEYILNNCPEEKEHLEIIKRAGKKDENATKQLSNYLYEFINKSKKEITLMEEAGREITKKVSWQEFIKNYFDVYDEL